MLTRKLGRRDDHSSKRFAMRRGSFLLERHRFRSISLLRSSVPLLEVRWRYGSCHLHVSAKRCRFYLVVGMRTTVLCWNRLPRESAWSGRPYASFFDVYIALNFVNKHLKAILVQCKIIRWLPCDSTIFSALLLELSCIEQVGEAVEVNELLPAKNSCSERWAEAGWNDSVIGAFLS